MLMSDAEVVLRPFKHQVGGHACVFEISRSAICKAYKPGEAFFYENMPEELRPFTPKYFGEAIVICETQDERKQFTANIPEGTLNLVRDINKRCRGNGDSHECNKEIPKKELRRKSWKDLNRNDSETKPSLEDWSSICITKQMKLRGYWANNRPEKFIIMENLVCDYERPCILDLKLGKPRLSDYCNEEKRKRAEYLSTNSTLTTLGFLIDGYQIYNVITQDYTMLHKNEGRALDDCGAVEQLRHFFHSDIELRHEVIRTVLHKLEALRVILLSVKPWHLKSASLLLMYDVIGRDHQSTNQSNTECVLSDMFESDNSYENVIESDPKVTKLPVNESIRNAKNTELDVRNVAMHNGSSTLDDTTSSITNSMSVQVDRVDVKLIDFVHVQDRSRSDNVENKEIADDRTADPLQILHDILAGFL